MGCEYLIRTNSRQPGIEADQRDHPDSALLGNLSRDDVEDFEGQNVVDPEVDHTLG